MTNATRLERMALIAELMGVQRTRLLTLTPKVYMTLLSYVKEYGEI